MTKQSQLVDGSDALFCYLPTTNKNNTAIYTGITNDLKRRVTEHKSKRGVSFTKRYHINKLVFYEVYNEVIEAIRREKQIKSGSRQRKIELIPKMNRNWRDLSEGL